MVNSVTIINGQSESSSSPSDAKMNGGVAISSDANDPKLHDVERAANAYSPYNPHLPAANTAVKLNGTASPFKPNGGGKTPIHFLNRDSMADTQPIIVTSSAPAKSEHVAKKQEGAQEPVGTRTTNLSPQRRAVYFTTDVGQFTGSHYLKIENIPGRELDEFLLTTQELDWADQLVGMLTTMSDDGNRTSVYCCFDDLKMASNAREDLIEMVQVTYPVNWSSHPEYAQATHGRTPESKTSFYDGQVVFVTMYEGTTTDSSVESIAESADKMVQDLADSVGLTCAFARLEGASWPNLEFRMEYKKISDAKAALVKYSKDTPVSVNDWKVYAKSLEGKTHDIYAAYDGRDAVQVAGTPHRNPDGTNVRQYTSPSGRTAWSTDDNGNTQLMRPMRTVAKVGDIPFVAPMTAYASTPYRHQSDPTPHTPHHGNHMMTGAYMGPRSGSWNGYYRYPFSKGSPRREPISGPQAVNVAKIRAGTDVRTTIMLRNIPNRMNCYELKHVLDKKTRGLYDFSYLRIDFQKHNNVGYAFVNFEDPESIAIFCEEWVGKCWQYGNPRRVQVSYATVQGYDCLVEKFRNSAIMEECPIFTPKLWFTVNTAPYPNNVGTEIAFPKPNNLSKHQRSQDNAGQIGLYAPRSGHQSRERGRRSQYDRGTPAQIHEESYYQHQQMSPLQNGYGHGYGYMHHGYFGMAPRMPVGPPPQFQQVVYGNGYDVNPYTQGNGFMPNQQYLYYDHADPFGPGAHHGGYANTNGHHNNGFGTSPGTPASRLRTVTNGKLGGRPRKGGYVGGPVHSPDGSYEASPEGGYAGSMPQVVEGDEEGYNHAPGPFHCPRY